MQQLRSYQLGEEVTYPVLLPSAPTAAPRYRVYTDAGDFVKAGYCSVFEKAELASLVFQVRLYLGSDFAPGHYKVLHFWGGALDPQADLACFEVLAGGSETGQVIALHSYERPHSNFVVQQRTSGRIYKGRNPRV